MLSSVTKEKLAREETRISKRKPKADAPCTKMLIDSMANTPLPQQHG